MQLNLILLILRIFTIFLDILIIFGGAESLIMQGRTITFIIILTMLIILNVYCFIVNDEF